MSEPLGQAGRRIERGNALQLLEKITESLVLRTGAGVVCEHPLQLARLFRRCLAVQDCEHQMQVATRIHLYSRSRNSSRSRWRASNRRDFTVFSSMSRMTPISR